MFDLSTQGTIPRYELKLPDGEVKSYDALLIGYKLQVIEGEIDPATIQQFVCTVLEIEVNSLQALQILDDFTTFAAEHLEGTLKKVFGRASSSTITSDSRPESSENSNQPST